MNLWLVVLEMHWYLDVSPCEGVKIEKRENRLLRETYPAARLLILVGCFSSEM